MSLSDDTFYNFRRLHAIFAGSSLALLGATIWVLAADHCREWKRYQRTYSNVPPAIRQVWLPELTLDYHFRRVARVDRCVTCHLGMETDKGTAASSRPQPFAPHPRLDLFVGADSPHPTAEFGCTVCHAGQGSATAFATASHSPNDVAQRQRWQARHGWSPDADWDLPMRPRRLMESGCLQCHHQPEELTSSRRFADPPAPKLVAGYQLVCRLGCFGCHEIRGVAETGATIGPDMRLEANERRAAGSRTRPAPRDARPHAEREEYRSPSQDAPRPGTQRKVGPSLRGLAGKLDRPFLLGFLPKPSDFRPESQMPQCFGLVEHLSPASRDETERLDKVEVRAVAEYLLSRRPDEATRRNDVKDLSVGNALRGVPGAPNGAGPPGAERHGGRSLQGASEREGPPSAERGRELFQVRGCLACHKHRDFPAADATVGPDLSKLGSKLGKATGKDWLADWLRDPTRYAPRTRMPDCSLSGRDMVGVTERHAARSLQADDSLSDPIADLTAYLLTGDGWKPPALPPLVEADLDQLVRGYLEETFPRSLAEGYLKSGVPSDAGQQARAGTEELAGPITREKKLRYVGQRAIARRGCYGCHDIPGFEAASPIGPELSDWGRKPESLLAFQRVHEFAAAATTPGADDFYLEALARQRREGFLWQKLVSPRSFDYQKTGHRGYQEQLRMGRFHLTDAQREAIMTFVLGLVADPPAGKYVCRPEGKERALVEGRAVIEAYRCDVCHTLALERWLIRTGRQGQGQGQVEVAGTPRVDAAGKPLVVEGEEEDVSGNPLPMLSFTLGEPALVNGRPWPVGGQDLLVYQRDLLLRRAAWGGQFPRRLWPIVVARAKAAQSGSAEQEAWGWLPPPLAHEGAKVQPAWLYQYLLNPVAIRPAAVLAMPKFNLSPSEAAKLVDYFAAASNAQYPYLALAGVAAGANGRPSRSFNAAGPNERRDLSPGGHAGFVGAGANGGHDVSPGGHAGRVGAAAGEESGAMRLLTDRKTFCAKCHRIGDYNPGGSPSTMAPDLEQVGRRIRPDYLRRWLTDPKSELPYTAMPVNFPPTGPPLGQDLAPATSDQQIDALTELLLNYDDYVKRRMSMRRIIEASP